MQFSKEQINKEIVEINNVMNKTQNSANLTLNEAKQLSKLSINIKETIKYFNIGG